MLENLSQIFLGTVDTYFAGQIGDNAIAAINVTNMFINLFVTVFTAFGVGIMVMISSALGEGDTAKANRLVRQAVLLGLGVGAGFGLLNFFCRRPFLRMAGAEGEILELGLTYYLAVCVPCVFLCLTLILAGGLKAARYTRTAFFATALAMTAAGAVLALFALPLTGLFTQTGQIRQMVAQVLTFMVLFNWTSALSHILTSAVQGTGDSRYPLWVTLAGNILMRLAAGYLLAYWLGWGLIGIWTGIVLDFLLRGTLLGARFIRQYKA